MKIICYLLSYIYIWLKKVFYILRNKNSELLQKYHFSDLNTKNSAKWLNKFNNVFKKVPYFVCSIIS